MGLGILAEPLYASAVRNQFTLDNGLILSDQSQVIPFTHSRSAKGRAAIFSEDDRLHSGAYGTCFAEKASGKRASGSGWTLYPFTIQRRIFWCLSMAKGYYCEMVLFMASSPTAGPPVRA